MNSSFKAQEKKIQFFFVLDCTLFKTLIFCSKNSALRGKTLRDMILQDRIFAGKILRDRTLRGRILRDKTLQDMILRGGTLWDIICGTGLCKAGLLRKIKFWEQCAILRKVNKDLGAVCPMNEIWQLVDRYVSGVRFQLQIPIISE